MGSAILFTNIGECEVMPAYARFEKIGKLVEKWDYALQFSNTQYSKGNMIHSLGGPLDETHGHMGTELLCQICGNH